LKSWQQLRISNYNQVKSHKSTWRLVSSTAQICRRSLCKDAKDETENKHPVPQFGVERIYEVPGAIVTGHAFPSQLQSSHAQDWPPAARLIPKRMKKTNAEIESGYIAPRESISLSDYAFIEKARKIPDGRKFSATDISAKSQAVSVRHDDLDTVYCKDFCPNPNWQIFVAIRHHLNSAKTRADMGKPHPSDVEALYEALNQ
jgi:hypothetical protein